MRKLLLLLAMLSPESWAGPCAAGLALPRDLRVTQELVDFAGNSETDTRLIRALERVFAFVNASDRLTEVARGLGDLSRLPVIEERSEYFDAYPASLNATTAANYRALRSLPATGLEDFDLGLLASLMPQVRWYEPAERVAYRKLENIEVEKKRLRFLFQDTRFTEIFHDLLQNNLTFGLVASLVMEKLHAKQPKCFGADLLTGFTERLGRGQLKDGDAILFHSLYLTLLEQLSTFCARRGFCVSDATRVADQVMSFERLVFLNTVETYYASSIRATRGLDTLRDLMDNVLFGTPIPMTANALRSMIVESAKTRLLDLKNRRSAEVERLKRSMTPVTITRPTLELTLYDMHAPAPVSNKRARVRSEEPSCATPEKTEAREPALRDFTSFTERPADLSGLDADVTYAFSFLRAQRPCALRLRIGPKAFAWLLDNPVEGRELLDAIHLGPARDHLQVGLKVWQTARPGGRTVYELKLASSVRATAMLVDGTWQLLEVGDKSSIARLAANAKPLD